jgi:hypothetical protein
MQTKDLDVFVARPYSSGGLLTLGAIYDYLLKNSGAVWEHRRIPALRFIAPSCSG